MLGKLSILRVLGTVCLLALITGVVAGLAWAQQVSAPVDTLPLAEDSPEWKVLTDSDYRFTLEYPGTWHPVITIEVPKSASKPEWILRRYSFIGGGLDIDIWAAHENNRELSSWLEWMGKITAPFPVLKPNGVAAGYPAVAFVEDQMVSVFVSDGQYVYRFWLTLSTKENLESYLHVLNTFRLSGTRTPGVQVPRFVIESAWQVLDAQSRCPKSFPGIGDSGLYSLDYQQGCDAVLNQGCCGLSSAYCSTYFSCSLDRATNQHKGNCTWYVCYQYGAVPFRRNAGTWGYQVPLYKDWRRTSLPQRGENIAWWGGDPGHVAYVSNYQGGGNVIISEMSWCESCGRTRTIAITNPWGYLWRVAGPTIKGEDEEPQNLNQ